MLRHCQSCPVTIRRGTSRQGFGSVLTDAAGFQDGFGRVKFILVKSGHDTARHRKVLSIV